MITLQFAGPQDWGGELITWYDHGKFAHVDAVLPDGNLLGARSEIVMEVPAGVQIRPASYLPESTTKLTVVLPCSDRISDAFYQFISEQIGKPYDEKAILGFVAGRNWAEEDSWFCSELVAAGMVKAMYVNQLSAPANKIAPDDLLLVCSALVPIEV